MGKIAFVFPGQGSQYVGMAKDLYENSDIARNLIDRANEVLGIDLKKIMFEGPEETLKQTEYTQPAIFLHSVVLNRLISKVKPEATAGHSLGEYSALVAAEAIDFDDAIKLVRYRGQAMQKAGVENPGTMAAVVGLTVEQCEKVVEEAKSAGIVQCANFNSQIQTVISGSVDGVRKAMEIAKANGAKIVKELPVSGAFHSPLMQSAKDTLLEKLSLATFNDAKIPVYANVTAKPVTKNNEIKDLLYQQVTAPVLWVDTILNLYKDGFTEFYEIGPGKVLTGLIKKIVPDANCYNIDKYEELKNYL